jgi:hypothetical protein
MFLVTAGCGGGEGAPPVRLSELEQQVFLTGCSFDACHGADSPQQGMRLKAPPSVWGELVNRPSMEVPTRMRVVPGNPGASYLLEKISQSKPAVGEQMPPGQPLTADKIAMVRAWIAAGALAD